MSQHRNAQLIEGLYAAFAALDADTMMACYAGDAHFRDEAFDLRGAAQIGAMWRMLCDDAASNSRDVWRLHAGSIEADDRSGRARWEVHYRFGAGGRPVHNVIDAEFGLRDGLIHRHVDRFPFWRWSRQALGTPGWMFGWTPWLRARVRAQAMANLSRFQARHPARD